MTRVRATLGVIISVFMLAASAPAGAAPAWTPPRTSWGDPDLRGTWPLDAVARTPMQRPPQYGDRLFLSDTEYAAAVKGAPYSSGTEAGIVDALRADGALAVSLVAVLDGEVIGHVAFSPVGIDVAKGNWYGLGPVCVAPGHQRQGIGQALIAAGLEQLKALEASGCVVLGAPGFYGRFGFRSDPELRYGEAPAAYFQRLVFKGPPPSGQTRFHPSFEA